STLPGEGADADRLPAARRGEREIVEAGLLAAMKLAEDPLRQPGRRAESGEAAHRAIVGSAEPDADQPAGGGREGERGAVLGRRTGLARNRERVLARSHTRERGEAGDRIGQEERDEADGVLREKAPRLGHRLAAVPDEPPGAAVAGEHGVRAHEPL